MPIPSFVRPFLHFQIPLSESPSFHQFGTGNSQFLTVNPSFVFQLTHMLIIITKPWCHKVKKNLCCFQQFFFHLAFIWLLLHFSHIAVLFQLCVVDFSSGTILSTWRFVFRETQPWWGRRCLYWRKQWWLRLPSSSSRSLQSQPSQLPCLVQKEGYRGTIKNHSHTRQGSILSWDEPS